MNKVLTSQVRINCSTWKGSTLIGYTDSFCICYINKEKNKQIFTDDIVRYYYKDITFLQDGSIIPFGNIRGSTQIVYGGFSFESQNVATMKKIRLEMGTSKSDQEYDPEFDLQSIGRFVTPLENGASEETTLGSQVVWDSLEFNVNINDGKILDGHYKDKKGNYHTGYHCLPPEQFNHNFEGTVSFDNIPLQKT